MKMVLSHILVAHQYEAEDVQRKLSQKVSKENFSALAQKFSICPSAHNGGALGEIELSRLDPDFAEAAQKLKPGEVSPVVRTRFGYHLILHH